ncbi:MAG: hypothetical protein P1Q69_07120 [Candidatus Thorarchaeota archaeon]|nr:hypothetical protein [Candidatus Thorarchaeota archaeon]
MEKKRKLSKKHLVILSSLFVIVILGIQLVANTADSDATKRSSNQYLSQEASNDQSNQRTLETDNNLKSTRDIGEAVDSITPFEESICLPEYSFYRCGLGLVWEGRVDSVLTSAGTVSKEALLAYFGSEDAYTNFVSQYPVCNNNMYIDTKENNPESHTSTESSLDPQQVCPESAGSVTVGTDDYPIIYHQLVEQRDLGMEDVAMSEIHSSSHLRIESTLKFTSSTKTRYSANGGPLSLSGTNNFALSSESTYSASEGQKYTIFYTYEFEYLHYIDWYMFWQMGEYEYWRPSQFYPDSGFKSTPYPQTRTKTTRDDLLRLGPSSATDGTKIKTFSDMSSTNFGFDLSCKLKLEDQITDWAKFEGDIPFGFSSSLSSYQSYDTVYVMKNTDSVSHEWNEYYWDTTTTQGTGYVITFVPYVEPPPSGGGCPYIACWNGTGYVLDNDILPASETSGGTDVSDYYALQQPIVPNSNSNEYNLRLVEFENEHSWIDSVNLLVASHPQGTTLVSTTDGELVTFSNPVSPISAFDEDEVNCFESISEVGGDYFHGFPGDILYLTFTRPATSSPLKLVMRADMKTPFSIEVQVPYSDGWITYAVVHPREAWAYEVVDLTPLTEEWSGNIEVRLVWTAEHKLDYVGLDTSVTQVLSIRSVNLKRATNSNGDDITRLLRKTDTKYAELLPGNYINLCFRMHEPNYEKFTFLLKSQGHYTTIGEESEEDAATPNESIDCSVGLVAYNLPITRNNERIALDDRSRVVSATSVAKTQTDEQTPNGY